MNIVNLCSSMRSFLLSLCLVTISGCSTQQMVKNGINTATLGLAVVEFESRYRQTSGLLLAFKPLFSAAEWQSIVMVEKVTYDIYRSAKDLLTTDNHDKQLKTLNKLITAIQELNFYYRQAYVQFRPKMAQFPSTVQRELVAFHRDLTLLQLSYQKLTQNQSDETREIISILKTVAKGLVVFGVNNEIDHSSRY